MATTTMPAPIKSAAKPTVTALMSQWAAGVKFEDLSKDAIYQAKRFLLDSIGCALGGYQQHDVIIALEVLDEIAGPGRATVIGTGKQMDAVSASSGQCSDDPLHGLQRHLLEARPIPSVRHFSGSDGMLRACEW